MLVASRSYNRTGDDASSSIIAVAVTGGLFAYLFSQTAGVAGAVAVTLGYLPWMRLQMRRSSRIKAFEKALPDSIEMCSRSLRAGHSLVGAIGNIAEDGEQPAREEFAEVFRKQNYGMPLRDALLQRPNESGAHEGAARTDVIILTHETVEGRMTSAIAAMQALPTVLAKIIRIRKEDLA